MITFSLNEYHGTIITNPIMQDNSFRAGLVLQRGANQIH